MQLIQLILAITINDLVKVVKKESFDIKWNTVLTVTHDDDLNNSSEDSDSSEELLDYFSSNDDDAKVFLIVNNDELGYLYSSDYLLILQKSLDKESKEVKGDIGLPGEINITIGSGNLINYICPVNGDYKIKRLELQNPRYLCKNHKGTKLVKEKI